MNDPLAQFRRKPLDASQLKERESAPEGYSAFGVKDRVERLRIRRAKPATRSPRYLHLQDIAYDSNFGTNFILCFDFMAVVVRGRNMQSVISALESGTADYIQEYDPKRWAKPADGEAVITSIEIIMQKENGSEHDDEKGDGSNSH